MFRYNDILNLFYLSHNYKFWWETDFYDLKKYYNMMFNSLPDKVKSKDKIECNIDNYFFILFHTDDIVTDKDIRTFNTEFKSYCKKYGYKYSKEDIIMLFVYSYLSNTINKEPKKLIKKYKKLFNENVLTNNILCDEKIIDWYTNSYKKDMVLYKRKDQINNIKKLINA